jgi:hypothetical protein
MKRPAWFLPVLHWEAGERFSQQIPAPAAVTNINGAQACKVTPVELQRSLSKQRAFAGTLRTEDKGRRPLPHIPNELPQLLISTYKHFL